MNVLDLFSGIGGFSLGLERAGMRTVGFCERDEYCQAVLRKHWPDVPCFTDIHAIDAGGLDRLGQIDLVCGGFPCQPFSIAGNQKAQNDDRYLWPEMRRVIALARPTWVIGENVTGIITLALDRVLADLEDDGYAGRPFVIPACAVDAKHRRDRVWIIATDTSGAKLREQPGGGCGTGREGQAGPGDDGTPRTVADSHGGERSQRRVPVGMGRHSIESQDGKDGNSSRARWPSEPGMGRVAHGIPGRVDRLRTIGNAVLPQIPEIIGRAIMSQC